MISARDLALAFRLALRELRSGQRRLTVFLGCMFLGVFAIAAVGSISEAVRAGLARDARALLGGDASVEFATQRPSDEELARLSARGTVSQVISLRGMARSSTPGGPGGEDTAMVALKGVDAAYPLYGTVTLDPPQPLADALRDGPVAGGSAAVGKPGDGPPLPGVVVDPLLLERFGVRVGDVISVGTQRFRIAAALLGEPDRVVQGITYGPRVLMSLQGLERTGLLVPGTLLQSGARIRLPAPGEAVRVALEAPPSATGSGAASPTAPAGPPGASSAGGSPAAASPSPASLRSADEAAVTTFVEAARSAFPDAGWRVESYNRAVPRIRNLLDRVDTDLMLIGIAALLVGGLGIAEAVRGYLASRMASIATLKCVGGGVATVLWTYLFQILLIGGAGIVAGCALGAAVPPLAAGLTGQLIPVQLDASVHAAPLLRAALLGLAILLAFSLRPLLLAGAVRPATLFRGYVAGGGNGLSGVGRVLVGTGFAVLAGLVWLFTPDARLAFGFMAGCAGCFAVFRVVAWGLRAGARRAPHAGNPSVRLGLASIHRPGAPTVNMVFALGLGLTALVGIAQIERNLSASLARDLSRDAPAFFFINVLPDQVAEFEALGNASGGMAGITRIDNAPMVRGRIVRIKGVPVQDVAVAPDAQWAVRGDRGLSHAATPPPDTELTAGAWWPTDYSGPPIISLSDDLARGFGVTVGDSLTFNILGREVTASIANVRKVDWMTFQLQFAVLFAPGLLDRAPATWVVTAYGAGAGMDGLYRTVTAAHPNVTAISMREILAEVRVLMERMGVMFRAMAGVMLATGLLVVAGAILADRQRRIYDAVIYKVCGATRRDILLALVTEFLTTGLVTGLFSAGTGTLAAWAAVRGLLKLPFAVYPGVVAATVTACVAFALVFGLAGTARALKEKPAPYLRNE
ncbi:FtsX-like permease family protein [Nitratidesulfovibrio liaohensis]|uniref:FtsX-like permease family protein n=1 Tax=Nitratidesulfovibrio liaohensis TaxID=2604158 RepID=A0ABY9QY96_9BACT|nr:FtsX-like permease family protein [Nitratidesulfovibrio liaohensis]WMW64511.1 FtsX-like permease family protein [Nitratidesulfovibrio liaohensis]